MIKVLTVCHDLKYAQPLIRSLVKHGWDYVAIETEWKGFGTKVIETYKYLKAHPEVTEFVFCDAFDVIVLGGEVEFKEKLSDVNMLVSAERGLWPPILQPFRSVYCQYEHGFNFPNSGCYYAKSAYFISLFETYQPFYEIDDQFWVNVCFNLEKDDIHLDYGQTIFNSHSFISDNEYGYSNNRIQILGNDPIFIHSNARTVDENLNNLLI